MAAPVFTPGQLTFIARYAKQTGLNPQVVAAQVFNEMNGSYAAGRQTAGNHNWLNIGWTDSGQRGTGNSLWMNPITAADASARWIKGDWSVPGFGRAAPGIRGILNTVGQGPAAQIAALQNSGWASGRYPNLPSIFQSVSGMKLPDVPAGGGVPLSASSGAGTTGASSAPFTLPAMPDFRGAVLSSLGQGSTALVNALVSAKVNAKPTTVPVSGVPAGGVPSSSPGRAVADVPAPTSKGMFPGLAEAFYDPLGQYDSGRFSSQGIGGHSDHVHISETNPAQMIRAIKLAQQMGLAVRENPYVDPVDPVHVKGSFHYQNFPGLFGGKSLGKGIDVSGSADKMAAFYRAITGT